MEASSETSSKNEKSFEDMVTSLEQNQIVFSFVNRINDLKKDGHKSFGIISVGYPELQHRVIIAASSLLQRYNLNDKLALVINSKSMILQKFMKKAIVEQKQYGSKVLSHYNFYHKFNFTVLEQFTCYHESKKESSYVDLINEYSANHDTILWDLPLVSEIKSNYKLYFPILQQMNDVFLVLPKTGTNKNEIEKVREYFANFNIAIRGIMLESDKPKTKKWWEFWK